MGDSNGDKADGGNGIDMAMHLTAPPRLREQTAHAFLVPLSGDGTEATLRSSGG